jgi:GxxExxY protein
MEIWSMTNSSDVTERIIGCAYAVFNKLGVGFLEKVYENALGIELGKAGLEFAQQYPIPVLYDGEVVGDFYADLLVEQSVIVELKSAKVLENVHIAQTLNYLRATGLKTGLLLNFGKPRIDVKRLSM